MFGRIDQISGEGESACVCERERMKKGSTSWSVRHFAKGNHEAPDLHRLVVVDVGVVVNVVVVVTVVVVVVVVVVDAVVDNVGENKSRLTPPG